jgi:cytochrome P450
MRIAPNILLTSDPEQYIRMNAVRSRYVKSKWYAGFKLEANLENTFSCYDEAKHTLKRSKMALGYSGKELSNFEAKIDSHVIDLISLIRRKYLTTGANLKPIDLAEKASFFTLDVITDLAFGHTWGCLQQDKDVDNWFGSMEVFLPLAMRVATIPILASLFEVPFIAKLIMPSERDEEGPGRLLRVSRDIVNARFASPEKDKGRDMLGSFIRRGVPKSELVAESASQMYV